MTAAGLVVWLAVAQPASADEVTALRAGEVAETLPMRFSQVPALRHPTSAVTEPASAPRRGLARELAEMLTGHPQIRAAANSAGAAEEAVGIAFAGYLPTLKLTAASGPEYQDTPTRRQIQHEPWLRGHDALGVVLTQRLFDGFATSAAVEGARRGKQAAEANRTAITQNVLLEAITAWLDVLKHTRLIALARDNEHNVRTQLKLEDERVRRGAGIAVDVLQAKHRLQVAKEQRIAHEGNLHAATARFIQVFGHPPEIAAMIPPALADKALPADREAAVAEARRGNPGLAAASLAVASAETRREAAEAGWYPVVELVAKADYERNREAVAGSQRDWSVLLQVNWDLFSGFRTRAATAQAGYDHAVAERNRDQQDRKLAQQTRLAWNGMVTARERVEILDNAAALAEEAFRLRRQQREAGKATALDVLDAESDVYRTRINHVSALFDHRVAMWQLVQAMGRLDLDLIGDEDSGPPS